MLLQLTSVLILFAVTFATEKKPPVDFCDPKWCPNQGRHIACNNTGSFGPHCKGVHWLEDLTEYKKLIIQLHDEARNKLALGEVENYKPACRMPSMKWDTKLTIMAELNVKTCEFEHDECRSTSEYPYCGQNIYYAQTTFTNYTVKDFILEAHHMWFDEYKDCNMDVINSFKLTEPQSGHFTAMMVDRSNRLGCGFLYNIIQRYRRKPLIKVIFTCNYPSTNIMDVPVYKAGPPASECQRRHYVYPGLCHEKEIIDPNDFTWYS